MTFLAPSYLWLFLLLIIPLILYLLPMPRRRVKTAALYLWERFLEKEPFGKASEKIRRAHFAAKLKPNQSKHPNACFEFLGIGRP